MPSQWAFTLITSLSRIVGLSGNGNVAHSLPPKQRIVANLILRRNKSMTNDPASGSTYEDEKANVGVGPSSDLATSGIGKDSQLGTASATASGLAQTAQDYGQKISDAASQAKDFVTERAGVVGDKIKELKNMDLGELTDNAKAYARQKPGQALLISAAAGLLLGLILRGRR
jgi:ElaB/YqjD/DUF883 family membrane-anchored ribosome-binding protein